jgi:mycothiol system anti-sigma-R factor
MSHDPPVEGGCRDVLDRVYEYLDGEMSEDDMARVRHHLDECDPCLTQYELNTALKALLRRGCACEPAPRDLRARIMVRITQVRQGLDP